MARPRIGEIDPPAQITAPEVNRSAARAYKWVEGEKAERPPEKRDIAEEETR